MGARMVRTVEDAWALDGNTPLQLPSGDLSFAAVYCGQWWPGEEGEAAWLPATVLAPAIDPDDEALVEKVARDVCTERRHMRAGRWACDYCDADTRAVLKAVTQ